METTPKLFFAFLLLCIFKQGLAAGPCNLANIALSQTKTGKSINGKPEFQVTISNNCICSQSNVKIRCAGFSTVEVVDPSIFKKIDGQDCLANDGLPIFQGRPISFKYASAGRYSLLPVDSQINCS